MTVTGAQIADAAAAVTHVSVASPALLVKVMGVGLADAGDLLTALEEYGVVGPPRGGGRRTVRVTAGRVGPIQRQILKDAS